MPRFAVSIACVLVPLALASPVRAQTMAGAVDARVASTDSIFARLDRPGSPGCVAAVMRAGEMVFARGYGMANVELGVPLTPRSVFDGGSLAKQFTAFTVALLAREGKLSLDDDVCRYVPELPDYGDTVTLRQLLHHTAGVREYGELQFLASNDLTPWELVVRQKGLSFAPGESHLYSNSGYLLLGRVVEKVEGKPLADVLAERIFRPLGMTGTKLIRRADELVPGRADGYGERAGQWLLLMDNGPPDAGPASVHTSPEDLAKWDRNFYDAAVGGPEVVRMMTTPGKLRDGRPIEYALGLHTGEYRGVRRIRHGGLWRGYRHQFSRFPDQRTSVLVMCNHFTEPNALNDRVADIWLSEHLAPLPAPAAGDADSAALARYAGTYVSRESQSLRPVRFAGGGGLEMRLWATFYPLRPMGGGRFAVVGTPSFVTFRPGGAGEMRMEEAAEGDAPTVYERIPDGAAAPAPLADYAGAFRSEELESEWRFDARGDTLVQRVGRDEDALRPAGRDAFTDGYLLVVFTRDAAGRVDGFTVATPRVRGVRFVRHGG